MQIIGVPEEGKRNRGKGDLSLEIKRTHMNKDKYLDIA